MAPKPYEWSEWKCLSLITKARFSSERYTREFWQALAQGLLNQISRSQPKLAEAIDRTVSRWPVTDRSGQPLIIRPVDVLVGDPPQTEGYWEDFRRLISDLRPGPGPLEPRNLLPEYLWPNEHIGIKGVISVLRTYIARRAADEAMVLLWDDCEDFPGMVQSTPESGTRVDFEDPIFGIAHFKSERDLKTWVGRKDERRLWAAALHIWGGIWANAGVPRGTWKTILDICMNTSIPAAEASLQILCKVFGFKSPKKFGQRISRQRHRASEMNLSWLTDTDSRLAARWKDRLNRARKARPMSG